MLPGKLYRAHVVAAAMVSVLVITLVVPAHGGWMPEAKLSHASGASYLSSNNARCLVAGESGALHLVWYDYRDGDSEIYHKYFDGAAWGGSIALTANNASSEDPAAAVDTSGTLHVVWAELLTGSPEIYHKSFDGVSWSAPLALTSGSMSSENPAIAADGLGRTHVVWRDYRDGAWGIYYTMFDGAIWAENLKLNDPAGYPGRPSIASDDSSHLHLVWADYRDGNWEVYHKNFDGSSWGADTRLTSDAGISEKPTVTVDSGENIHVVWRDNRSGSFDIYHKSHDGMAWGADNMVAAAISEACEPSLAAADDGSLYLVWFDDPVYNNHEIFYRVFDGVVWSSIERLTDATKDSENPMIEVDSSGLPHIVWHDNRGANFEIYWRVWSTLPKPGLVSIEPDSGHAFTSVHINDLAGSDFFDPVKVWLQMAGEDDVQATGEVTESATRITCDFNLGGVPGGNWDVVVENADLQRDTLVAGFRVIGLPPPKITSIEPDSAYAYPSVHINDLAGIDFFDPVKVWLQMVGEDDVQATGEVTESATRIICDFNLWGVSGGNWDVVVENADLQCDTLVAGFRVVTNPAPEILSIEPAVAVAYDDVHIVDLAGGPFASPALVWLEREGEDDIDAANVTVESQNQISCDFNLTGAEPGDWDVAVQNLDGQSGLLPAGLTILPSLWTDDLRLTDDVAQSYLSESNARCIAVDSQGHIHVVWSDRRDGNWEIYYKTFGGASWSSDQRLTFTAHESANPSIAVDSDDNLHLVWDDTYDGNFEIYHKEFDGISWSSGIKLSNAYGDSRYPSIAVDRYDRPFVVWQYGGAGIYFTMRNSLSWQNPDNLGHLLLGSVTPTITVTDDNHVHVAWSRQDGDDHQICYTRRVDNLWTSIEIIDDSYDVYGPTIARDHLNQVHVAWYDRSHGNYEVSYRKFNGSTWEPVERVTEAPHASTNPSIAVDDSLLVHMVWADEQDGNQEIYYARRDGSAWGVQTRLTKAPYESGFASLALAPTGEVHLVWRDMRDGNHEIYYKGWTDNLAGVDARLPVVDPFTRLRVMPNPVQVSTRIEFNLEMRAEPLISVYDAAGRLVSQVCPGPLGRGPHQIVWNGKGSSGRRVAPGVYFIEVSTTTRSATVKTIVLR